MNSDGNNNNNNNNNLGMGNNDSSNPEMMGDCNNDSIAVVPSPTINFNPSCNILNDESNLHDCMQTHTHLNDCNSSINNHIDHQFDRNNTDFGDQHMVETNIYYYAKNNNNSINNNHCNVIDCNCNNINSNMESDDWYAKNVSIANHSMDIANDLNNSNNINNQTAQHNSFSGYPRYSYVPFVKLPRGMGSLFSSPSIVFLFYFFLERFVSSITVQ